MPLKESQLFHFGDRLDGLATDDTPIRTAGYTDCIPHKGSWGILFLRRHSNNFYVFAFVPIYDS